MADDDQGAKPAETTDDKPKDNPAPATEVKEAPLGDAGQKALDAFKERARKAEAQIKELKPLAERANELEEAQKSEVEKAKDKLTKAEQAKAVAEAKLLRFEVAQEKEVPAKLVPLLTAADKEGLEAQADLILENVKEGTKTPNFDGGVQTPAPDSKKPEDQHNELALKLLGRSPNP